MEAERKIPEVVRARTVHEAKLRLPADCLACGDNRRNVHEVGPAFSPHVWLTCGGCGLLLAEIAEDESEAGEEDRP